jgi:hypothetical protein
MRGRALNPTATIGVPSGRLRWVEDGDDLLVGRYRIRLLGPLRWETTYRGEPLCLHRRRSQALAAAEHHHREARRTRQIRGWLTVAGAGLVVALVAVNHLTEPAGFLSFVSSVGVFLSALARATASATRNLLDPYRTRESWEDRTWWNEHD